MKTLKKNEEIKGKIVTFNSFRELLLNEFNKNFPNEYEDYVKIRAETAPQLNNMDTLNQGPGNIIDPNAEPASFDVGIVKKEEPVEI